MVLYIPTFKEKKRRAVSGSGAMLVPWLSAPVEASEARDERKGCTYLLGPYSIGNNALNGVHGERRRRMEVL